MSHNTPSSLKNVKTNTRNNLQNRNYKGAIKRSIKNYLGSLNNFKLFPNLENENIIKKSLSIAYSSVDRAHKKKFLHKNKAIRTKLQLKNIFLKLKNLKI